MPWRNPQKVIGHRRSNRAFREMIELVLCNMRLHVVSIEDSKELQVQVLWLQGILRMNEIQPFVGIPIEKIIIATELSTPVFGKLVLRCAISAKFGRLQSYVVRVPESRTRVRTASSARSEARHQVPILLKHPTSLSNLPLSQRTNIQLQINSTIYINYNQTRINHQS